MTQLSNQNTLWDAFISHAKEDKSEVVEPLFTELQQRGYRIWYDRYELKIGDSLRESIERGLIHSRYGIVVLSKSFLKKRWPKSELDGLLAREFDGRKVILPIWHGVTEKEIANRLPILAGRLAIDSSEGTSAIADAICDVLGEPSLVSTTDAINLLPVRGNQTELEALVRNVLISASTTESKVAETKLAAILDALRAKNVWTEHPVPATPPLDEPKEATRYDQFVALGRSGKAKNVDYMMEALSNDNGIGTAKLVDFALGLIATDEGERQIRHYLFNGNTMQRNYAALYFKRKVGATSSATLTDAHREGKIDALQAFSK
ncbi:MAG: toll/interleukin-1 receptor domain-containing protein [Chlorobiaceae bacterium]